MLQPVKIRQNNEMPYLLIYNVLVYDNRNDGNRRNFTTFYFEENLRYFYY